MRAEEIVEIYEYEKFTGQEESKTRVLRRLRTVREFLRTLRGDLVGCERYGRRETPEG